MYVKLTQIKLIFLCISLATVVSLTLYLTIKRDSCEKIRFDYKHRAVKTKYHLIETKGCNITNFKTFDGDIMKLMKTPSPIKCQEYSPPLVQSNLTSIYILQNNSQYYSKGAINCCYSKFWKANGTTIYGHCIPFNNSVRILEEFINVRCSDYDDYFVFFPKKPIPDVKRNRKPLNVLVMGLDAVSRLNFLRQLPKTYSYLQELQVFEFLGFNNVGENTFPNVIPLLSGKTVEELQEICWNSSTTFDRCHFIWNDYKKEGFLTAMGEDTTPLGIFEFNKKGFLESPTDYYYTFFQQEMERMLCNTPDKNIYVCVRSKTVHESFMENLKKFLDSMEINKSPYFGLFWTNSMTHDYLNRPKLVDDIYMRFFKYLNSSGILNGTVLIVTSDHGIRLDEVTETRQGWYEKCLPMLYMVLPKWYMKENRRIVSNLRINTKRLVTQFDVHETLKDLMKPFEIKNKKEKNKKFKNSNRGISFFDFISEERNCSLAGIPKDFCRCEE